MLADAAKPAEFAVLSSCSTWLCARVLPLFLPPCIRYSVLQAHLLSRRLVRQATPCLRHWATPQMQLCDALAQGTTGLPLPLGPMKGSPSELERKQTHERASCNPQQPCETRQAPRCLWQSRKDRLQLAEVLQLAQMAALMRPHASPQHIVCASGSFDSHMLVVNRGAMPTRQMHARRMQRCMISLAASDTAEVRLEISAPTQERSARISSRRDAVLTAAGLVLVRGVVCTAACAGGWPCWGLSPWTLQLLVASTWQGNTALAAQAAPIPKNQEADPATSPYIQGK